jgi:hypothetical protein
MIKVKFYGTRGSISVCGPKFQEFGGNTTCLQVTDMKTNRIGIFDAGTGIRDLGNDLVASGHDPDHDDEFLLGMEKQCQERFPNCVLAREKMEIEIK